MCSKRLLSNEQIIELYESNIKMSEISQKAGISTRAIRNVIKKNDVTPRKIGQPRKNRVNENYFKTWSDEMAWVLGLIITDGHIVKHTSTICLSQKEEYILKLVSKRI